MVSPPTKNSLRSKNLPADPRHGTGAPAAPLKRFLFEWDYSRGVPHPLRFLPRVGTRNYALSGWTLICERWISVLALHASSRFKNCHAERSEAPAFKSEAEMKYAARRLAGCPTQAVFA